MKLLVFLASVALAIIIWNAKVPAVDGTQSLGQTVTSTAYDQWDLPAGSPVAPLLKQFRNATRKGIMNDASRTAVAVSQINSNTTPQQFRNAVEGDAQEASDWQETEEWLRAKAEGRTLSTAADTITSANAAKWHRVTNRKGQTVVVHKGEVLVGIGEVESDYYPGTKIGPNGITVANPPELADYSPAIPECPTYSLCGVVIDKDRQEHRFFIGEHGTAPATGELWIRVNVPLHGPWGTDTYIARFRSEGNFEIKSGGLEATPQTSHQQQNNTEEHQTASVGHTGIGIINPDDDRTSP